MTQPPPPGSAMAEITALTELLHRTGQRLEELTAGQVDAVADHAGHSFLLRQAQDVLRDREAMTQAAILNALPAQVAMLDRQGVIVAVNEAWRCFAVQHGMRGPSFGIGVSYLDVCDVATGSDAPHAQRAAAGIRSVLVGGVAHFSMQYPCDAPNGRGWFVLTVASLSNDGLGGVVVMHFDVTQRETAVQEQVAMQQLLTNIVENIPTAVLLKSVTNDFRFQLWNKAAEAMYGLPRGLAIGSNVHALWPAVVADRMHAADLELLAVGGVQDLPDRTVVRYDGTTLQAHMRKVALFDDHGDATHLLVIADDITERRRREQDLLRFKAAIDVAADAIYLVDRASMRCIYANDGACKLFEHTHEELLTAMPWDVESTSRQALEQTYDAVISSGELLAPVEVTSTRRDGSHGCLEVRRHARRTGDQWTIVVVARDISERKEAVLRIAHLSRVHAMLSGINALIVRVQHTDELFGQGCRVAVDAGGFRMAWIAVANPHDGAFAVAGSAGVDDDLLADIGAGLRASAGTRPDVAQAASLLRRAEPLVLNDLRLGERHGFGHRHLDCGILSMAMLPLTVAGETAGVLVFCADEAGFFRNEEMKLLTELAGDIAFAMAHIERKQRMDYLAYYDALTGLANRGLFLERLAQHMRGSATGTRLALFIVDLKGFKDINDSFGRPAGDALLQQVAEWLKLNAADAPLLSRIAGDQFAVLMLDVRQEGDLHHLVRKVLGAFAQHPFRLNASICRVAAHAGVAVFPRDGLDAEALVQNAEAALKKSKTNGDPYLFYNQGMRDRLAGRLTLENQLREALEHGEFVLHYQPKIDAATGRLCGAEALIRWNDPRTGLVPPARFIPVLEETGLIHDVGRWALRTAVDDYMAWCASGLSAVRIAVNVSALQLRHRDFIEEVMQAIAVDPRAAAGLELEITESVVMGDVKHSVTSLQAIRAMGVSVAIDDFGTGFSSLSYLSRLPLDTLKIDRSFVFDMTADAEGLALVRTIIDLAHSLRLKVVAEGVETQEQSRLLRELGCNELQGFMFSKALPRAQFEEIFLGGVPA